MSILAEDAPYSKRQGEFVCIIHAFNSSKGLTLTDLKELFKSACVIGLKQYPWHHNGIYYNKSPIKFCS